MKIAVIVAMDKELNLLMPLVENTLHEECPACAACRGNVAGHDVAVMKCGIGKVNAAAGALSLIDSFAPDLVINTGVAGGAGAGTHPGDVIAGARVAYHDVWCGPGTEPGEADGCPRFFVPPTQLLVSNALRDVRKGLIASGDTFITSPEEVERIRGLYPDVAAIDMESAAIAQACYMRGVDFLSVRVVSDTPGDADNLSQYESFWDDAPLSTFNILKALLADL